MKYSTIELDEVMSSSNRGTNPAKEPIRTIPGGSGVEGVSVMGRMLAHSIGGGNSRRRDRPIAAGAGPRRSAGTPRRGGAAELFRIDPYVAPIRGNPRFVRLVSVAERPAL